MRKISSPFRFAVYVLCALCLFGLRAYGQEKEEVKARPNGIVQDWTRRYTAYPRVGPLHSLISLQNDPRAILSWQESARKDWRRWRGRRRQAPAASLHPDWNIPLSPTTDPNVIPANMFPAKYVFDVSAAPSCANDTIAFPVNAGLAVASITGTITNASTTVTITAGTITAAYVGEPITGTGIPAGATIATVTGSPATSITLSVAATSSGSQTLIVSGQPNLVVFSNLYSGTTPVAGLCNRAPSGTDDGVSATVFASYYMHAGGGQIATSPALSLDGTKLAIVETGPGQPAVFEVIGPRSGDGVDLNNSQNVLLPLEINSFDTAAPGGHSGAASALTLGSSPDSNSAPFVDYLPDQAYVGNDAGTLFRINDVFCATPTCQNTLPSRPAPSLDSNWGTGGALSTGCPGKLTGPVVDFNTGNIFVGCSDGKLYGFTSAGVALTGSPIIVGNGAATGGIVDPPMVDVVNGFLYVAAGNSAGGTSVLAQIHDTATTMSLTSTATMDTAPVAGINLHAPAFNEAYFSDPTPANWILFEYSPQQNTETSIWGMSFSAGHAMTAGTPTHHYVIPGGGPFEASPLTTFFNGTTDILFVGVANPGAPGDSEIDSITITGSTFPNSDPVGVSEGIGTSGIVVDNNDVIDGQTSSVYFGVIGGPTGLRGNSAVKLTQATLQ